MDVTKSSNGEQNRSMSGRRRAATFLVILAVASLNGCASLTNPVANGVPVRRVPPELLGETRGGTETIPLTTLRQPPPKTYLLAAGDILGIWIEGVLGEKGQIPPIRSSESGNVSPSVGYPVPVRSDGTVALPLVDPIRVDGLSIEQAQEEIRKAYTEKRKILVAGRERILVSLQQPRVYHVLVIRQDSGNTGGGGGVSSGRSVNVGLTFGGAGVPRGTQRGSGFTLNLPAYENDVLNALARTGGFPGSDAVNEVVIERGSFQGEAGREDLLKRFEGSLPDGCRRPQGGAAPSRIIRIPLRHKLGQQPQINPKDIILEDGDVVYIEARETDVFYTGGLLPTGTYPLPRDSDLDVIEAVSAVGGTLLNGGFSSLNVNGQTLGTAGAGGSNLGGPSPSLLSIVRRTPDGGQFVIRVDLNRAFRDPRERITIQPRDMLILQQTPDEAIARYFTNAIQLNIFYRFLMSSRATGTSNITVP